jgi:glyoxylase-like metal-dependent hydrolase (beta-lactamase superfamily II)
LIVLTHFHADHVGGVVTAPNARELARKAIVSTETANYMVNAPHAPEALGRAGARLHRA